MLMVCAPPPPESEVVRRVTVRLSRDDEGAQYDPRLQHRRHLHRSSLLAGRNLRHIAELDGQWLLEQEPAALARLAVGGKVLRGSGRRDGRPLQLLSAVTHYLRLALGQIPIEAKGNAIPALKPLLRGLGLSPGS